MALTTTTLHINAADFTTEAPTAYATVEPTRTVRDPANAQVVVKERELVPLNQGTGQIELVATGQGVPEQWGYRITLWGVDSPDMLSRSEPKAKVLARGVAEMPPGQPTYDLADLSWIDQPDPQLTYPRLAEVQATADAATDAAQAATDAVTHVEGYVAGWRDFDAGNLVLDAQAAAADAANAASSASDAADIAQGVQDDADAALTAANEVAVHAEYIGVDSRDYVTHGGGEAQASELQSALDEAGASSMKMLRIAPGEIALDAPVTAPEGVTVAGERGAVLRIVGDNAALIVESGVTVRDLTIKGTNAVGGVASRRDQRGITASGAWDSFKRDITIENCTFQGLEYRGVSLGFVDGWRVAGCTFRDTGLAAVSITCARNGQIQGNHIVGTGVTPEFTSNSYGVAVTMNSSEVGQQNPRPENISITDNIVENQAWEALDTHAGRNILFANNICRDVECGIAVTERLNADGGTPHTVTVVGNTISGDNVAPEKKRTGITVNGTMDPNHRADVLIANNVVSHLGAGDGASSLRSGGIVTSRAFSAVVSGNLVKECSNNGIVVWDVDYVNIAGNVTQDIYRYASETRMSAAGIGIGPVGQSVLLSGNQMAPIATGARYNEASVQMIVSSIDGRVIDAGSNDWAGVPWAGGLTPTPNVTDSVDVGSAGRGAGDGPGTRDINGNHLTNGTPVSLYPAGESHRNAFNPTENGWPFNGLLVTYNYGNRSNQVLYEYGGGGAVAVRAVTSSGSWQGWRTLQAA